jgi:hypothetical protein
MYELELRLIADVGLVSTTPVVVAVTKGQCDAAGWMAKRREKLSSRCHQQRQAADSFVSFHDFSAQPRGGSVRCPRCHLLIPCIHYYF